MKNHGRRSSQEVRRKDGSEDLVQEDSGGGDCQQRRRPHLDERGAKVANEKQF